MLLLLILFGLTFKAAAQITGSGNVTGVYGGNAHYSCTVANPTGVLQVTWQRLFLNNSMENLATYSKRFGQQVNPPFRGKVVFTEASLTSTSIALNNVTWGDDSCYICSFNVYPDGSKRKLTCLTVKGISAVNTSAHAPSGDSEEEEAAEDEEEVVFSCSATGKPAPTVEWEFSPGASPVSQPLTTTRTNGDQTITSSRELTLRVDPGWDGYVDCVLNRGMLGQRRERIPFSLGPGNPNRGDGVKLSSSGVALVICVAIVILVIAVAAAVKRKRLKGNRNHVTI